MEPITEPDREIVAYRVRAGECPGAAAGDAVFVFQHYGVADPGETLAYADADAPGGVSAGDVVDVLDAFGDTVYLVSAPDPDRPSVEVPYDNVVGEVMAVMDGETLNMRTTGATPPPPVREGVGETGPVRVPRPRRARRRG